MLSIAQHLLNKGHQVTFITAELFRNKATASGVRFVPLTGKANLDYRFPDDLVERTTLVGMERMLHTVRHWVIDPIPDQYRCMQQILKQTPADVILVDTGFFGCLPMLLGRREDRPPIIGCGVNPLMLSSLDCGLTSPPDTTPEGRRRNHEANLQWQADFQQSTDQLNQMLVAFGVPPMSQFFGDSMYLLPDLFLQFSGEDFEFTRTDLPPTVRFVGPILPKLAANFQEPAWWSELDDKRPVVLVTQGTFANLDLSELIQPTLSALAGEDVFVIAAIGRADIDGIAAPPNARVEPFVPFDRLLPKVDVFVTNGGYGAVHQALSVGVPIVIAGESEEKAFIAARVGWTGAGINLETGRPSEEQIRTAVRTVLHGGQHRREAQRLQAHFAQYNALDEIARTVDSFLIREESMVTALSL
jgi:MGT family glycosyltransferase